MHCIPDFDFCRNPLNRFVGTGGLVAVLIFTGGCNTPPRAQLDTEGEIAAVAGLTESVTFRIVGPAGGAIDESLAPNGSLTLADAVRLAVTTDPGLQAALARIQIASADADQMRLLPNPVLNVVFRWGAGGGGTPQIEAALAQDFVQVLAMPRRASAADNRVRQVAADAVTIALDVAGELRERYAAAQASAALLPILKQRLEILDNLATAAQARLDAGEGTRGDVATLSAQRVELQVEIDETQLTEREDRLRLARLIGVPSSAAEWTLDSWSVPQVGLHPEPAWIDAGLRHRPEIQALVWRLKALGDDAALARLLPWDGGSAGIDVQHDGEWTAGPSVATPLPLFDTGDSRRARVTAEQFAARHDLTLTRRKIVEEVRVALHTLTARTANLARIHDELIPLQQQRHQIADIAYRTGQSDVTALFLAEQDLRIAQARSIAVEHQAAIALIRLQRAVGGPSVVTSLISSGSTSATHIVRTSSASPVTLTP